MLYLKLKKCLKLLLIVPIIGTLVSCGNSEAPPSPGLKGEWETSGGDAVVCKNSTYVLDYWEYFLNSLNTANKDELSSDQIYDSQKAYKSFMKRDFFNVNPIFEKLSFDQIVDMLIKKIWTVSPLFGDQIRHAIKNSNIKKWQPKEKLKNINDSKPIRNLPSGCELKQLVRRFSQEVRGKIPKLKLYYDKKIFDKLTETQKAVIFLHEVIYLIARKDGHKSSNDIRKLVAFLFSSEFEQFSAKPSPLYSLAFRRILRPSFGDYMKYFVDESDFSMSKNIFLNSTISYMKKTRNIMQKCIEEGNKKPKCLKLVHLDPKSQALMTSGEAFMYYARFRYDEMTLNGYMHAYLEKFNSEYLASDYAEMQKKLNFKSELFVKKICKELDSYDHPKYYTVTERAKDFCRESGNKVTKIKERHNQLIANCKRENLVRRGAFYTAFEWNDLSEKHKPSYGRLLIQLQRFGDKVVDFNLNKGVKFELTKVREEFEEPFDSSVKKGSGVMVLNSFEVPENQRKNLLFNLKLLKHGVTYKRKDLVITKGEAIRSIEADHDISVLFDLNFCVVYEGKWRGLP